MAKRKRHPKALTKRCFFCGDGPPYEDDHNWWYKWWACEKCRNGGYGKRKKK